MHFVDWTHGLDSQTELEMLLNNNPDIIHLFTTEDAIVELQLLVPLFLTRYWGNTFTN